jgi:6-phosphogluconolactonase
MAERGTNKMNITQFENAQAITEFLTIDISRKLADAITNNGKASLVVSGGRSPIALFNALSTSDIDWSKVIISLVDDRWVGSTHESSNELLVKTHLLINNASAATFIGLVGQQKSAFDGVNDAVTKIASMTQIDIMILGMGEDGHTASIFPCCEQVIDAMSPDNHSRLIATQPATAAFERISLTLNEILDAKHVYLPLSGEGKVSVFETAQQLSDYKKMPISAVINQHNALDVLISK